MTGSLPAAVTEYIEASNTFDGARLIAAFAADAFVNDARREFWGAEAIRAWSDREIIGDKVAMDVRGVAGHHGMVVVNAQMDGEFDKTSLPDPLTLTHYFTVHDGKIVTLFIIRNVG